MDHLQWGNRKRLRCVKIKDASFIEKSDLPGVSVLPLKKKITSLTDGDKEVLARPHPPLQSPTRVQSQKASTTASSPEKEERYYTTRAVALDDHNTKMLMDSREHKRANVWPKLFITLSSKEKEEDFMAMKGCKLPQRPRKRAKLVQKALLMVSPGAWLSDLCKERYEVREKKASKKKPRGLKALGNMESDSE